MKILHITAAYKPAFIYGGPTMSVALLCEELNKADCTIEVFTTTANGTLELSVTPNQATWVDGVKVTYFKRVTKDHTHLSPALIKEVWKRAGEFDIVHVHTWWNLVALLACLAAILKKIPVVVSPRGMLSNYSFANKNMGMKSLIHTALGKRLLQKCNLHVTSQNETEAVGKLVTPLSITNIPNFVKTDPNIVDADKQSTGVLKLLFFSRIEEKKGLDILLKALPLINLPLHLTIAGSGNTDYIDYLKNITIDNGTAAQITWAGFYGDDKFELLRRHDLLVLPSYDENFGNVVIESLSAGTGVLISTHVGLADYVMANKLGWVCQTTPQSVSDAINDIGINHQPDLKRISKLAPPLVNNHFTGSGLTQQYINLYQKIIGHE